MNKNIPAARAIWLVKCVGANEMRAFKRKGAGSVNATGGACKWIREWTTQVEQFLEGTVALCGKQGDWRSKMDYAVRLVSYLYTEQILDQDHFLDWLITSLEGWGTFDKIVDERKTEKGVEPITERVTEQRIDRTPVWLLLVQIYWKDLVAVRKRGRRLAE
ncbi:hypothetical protein LTS18_002573, partial [Coniosporium uncinatum]